MIFSLLFSALISWTPAPAKPNFNLNDELVKPEWEGSADFLAVLKKENMNPCSFIAEYSEKYSPHPFIKGRLLAIASATKCKERLALVKKSLNSNHPFERVMAIQLAETMKKSEQKMFRKKIRELQQNDMDSSVQRACNSFLKD